MACKDYNVILNGEIINRVVWDADKDPDWTPLIGICVECDTEDPSPAREMSLQAMIKVQSAEVNRLFKYNTQDLDVTPEMREGIRENCVIRLQEMNNAKTNKEIIDIANSIINDIKNRVTT